jgi:hypothetical protein
VGHPRRETLQRRQKLGWSRRILVNWDSIFAIFGSEISNVRKKNVNGRSVWGLPSRMTIYSLARNNGVPGSPGFPILV